MQSSIFSMGKEVGLREGKLEGKLEGLREGEAKGLREAVEVLCSVLAIRLTPARKTHLASLDVDGLEALLSHLRTDRRWSQTGRQAR